MFNMFATEKACTLTADRFNHCSCVCPHKPGQAIVAWYTGTQECHADQRVCIAHVSRYMTDKIELDAGTGNPIVWKEQGRYWIIFSKFGDIDNNALLSVRRVDRWKTCSLWIQEIAYDKGIQLIGEPKQLAEPEQHLLARCGPLTISNITYVPLYDEVNRCCVLYAGQDGEYEEYIRFGQGVIQPTIWAKRVAVDPECEIEFLVNALCRNFGNRKFYSQYYNTMEEHCESHDISTLDRIAKNWQHIGDSGFYNTNNSIHVINWKGEEIALWNDSRSPRRQKMTIGKIKWQAKTPRPSRIKIMGEYGSYPSIACDDKFLYFSFTNEHKEIEYYAWNRKQYEQTAKAANDRRGGNLTKRGRKRYIRIRK